MLDTLGRRAESLLWTRPESAEGTLGRPAIHVLRFLYALARDFLQGELTLRAMSLVFTTLLSLVPLIAFSFSVLKGFGFHNQLEPMLYSLLEPLGTKGGELTSKIITFVDNVNGGLLGGVGLALLLFSVLSMVQKVEGSFNYIWRVAEERSLARRFSDYLSVLLIGPLLTVAAIGLIASVSSSAIVQSLRAIEPFGSGLVLAGRLGPYLLLTFVFAFVYSFITNTRVRLAAAVVGGVSAGVMWVVAGRLFAAFVVGSTKYAAIYASFAVAIIGLLWIYVAWLILLVGAQIAFYFQHPEYMRKGAEPPAASGRERETLALSVMSAVGHAFRNSECRIHQDELAAKLKVPREVLASVVGDLEQAGLLICSDKSGLLPGRDLDRIALYEIIQAVRQAGDQLSPKPGLNPAIDTLVESIDDAMSSSLEGKTARELVDYSAEIVAGSQRPPRSSDLN